MQEGEERRIQGGGEEGGEPGGDGGGGGGGGGVPPANVYSGREVRRRKIEILGTEVTRTKK